MNRKEIWQIVLILILSAVCGAILSSQQMRPLEHFPDWAANNYWHIILPLVSTAQVFLFSITLKKFRNISTASFDLSAKAIIPFLAVQLIRYGACFLLSGAAMSIIPKVVWYVGDVISWGVLLASAGFFYSKLKRTSFIEGVKIILLPAGIFIMLNFIFIGLIILILKPA